MTHLKNLRKPLAIAMWDYTWLLRHYRYGGFENWDEALDELVDRGYNAVRIDVFPNLVAADRKGIIQDEFTSTKANFGVALWGNEWSIRFNPRKALLDFLQKCSDRKIYVGLASWFWEEDSKRNERIQGLAEYVRIWDETLCFINDNKLMEQVIYVDILNEYPLYHGFQWLHNMLQTMSEPVVEGRDYNPNQINFYNSFLTEAVKKLKAKWTDLDFYASLTENTRTPWQEIDFSSFSAIDKHMWFVCLPWFSEKVQYFDKIHSMTNDNGFEDCCKSIISCWNEDKQKLMEDMELNIKSVAAKGKEYGIPVGNTEGWGAIYWMDHPALDWDWIKEAGEVCARLGAKYEYKFNCTSNFTHPYFRGIWKDVEWHRKVTSIIKNGY